MACFGPRLEWHVLQHSGRQSSKTRTNPHVLTAVASAGVGVLDIKRAAFLHGSNKLEDQTCQIKEPGNPDEGAGEACSPHSSAASVRDVQLWTTVAI